MLAMNDKTCARSESVYVRDASNTTCIYSLSHCDVKEWKREPDRCVKTLKGRECCDYAYRVLNHARF